MPTLKLKQDDNGHVVVSADGFPVYTITDDNGNAEDIPVDVPNLYLKVPELTKEATKYRKQRNEERDKLKTFEGIEDVKSWKTEADKAIETVKNFKDKDLVDAGKVEEIRAATIAAKDEEIKNVKASYESKIGDLSTSLDTERGINFNLMVSDKFSRSPWFVSSDGNPPKTILKPAYAEAYYGKSFKVEEGDNGNRVVVGYDLAGNQIYSKKRPGQLADFDEAIEHIINTSPDKDDIIRAGKAGSGADGGQDGGKGPTSDIAKLEVQYAEAQKTGDGKSMIALKNRIHDLRMKQQIGA